MLAENMVVGLKVKSERGSRPYYIVNYARMKTDSTITESKGTKCVIDTSKNNTEGCYAKNTEMEPWSLVKLEFENPCVEEENDEDEDEIW